MPQSGRHPLASDGLNLRPPRPGDAARLTELAAQLGYADTPAALAARLSQLSEREDQCIRVAEVAGGEIVGWIHALEHLALESGPWCEIIGLVVDAGQRQRGAGRILVSAVEIWARSRGLRIVKVRTNIVRPESHPFYERLGFARFKTQHVYRKSLG